MKDTCFQEKLKGKIITSDNIKIITQINMKIA
jgi:hypothetical protein